MADYEIERTSIAHPCKHPQSHQCWLYHNKPGYKKHWDEVYGLFILSLPTPIETRADGEYKQCPTCTGKVRIKMHEGMPVESAMKLLVNSSPHELWPEGWHTWPPVVEAYKRLGKPIAAPKAVYLHNYFDRVVVVNLKRRPDRLERFQQELSKGSWPFTHPETFEAVDGGQVPVPMGWPTSAGAWGCLQSHRQILEQAIMDGVGKLLVLEDDVCLCDDFVERTQAFLNRVPDDWDQLMLGGQHLTPCQSLTKGIVLCVNCQRTHAYAVRDGFMRDLYSKWCSATSQTHCDHIMGPLQPNYRVYAPEPFLCGQEAGPSDITSSVNERKFWN